MPVETLTIVLDVTAGSPLLHVRETLTREKDKVTGKVKLRDEKGTVVSIGWSLAEAVLNYLWRKCKLPQATGPRGTESG